MCDHRDVQLGARDHVDVHSRSTRVRGGLRVEHDERSFAEQVDFGPVATSGRLDDTLRFLAECVRAETTSRI